MISSIIIQSIGMYLGKINFKPKRITKLAFLTSFLILTCPILASSVLADTNLVLNPDLESGTTTPLNWKFVDQGGNIPIWDSTSHSGLKSLKISIPGTTNMISGYPQSDLITVEPLTTYTASVWGKTQNTGGSNTPAARVVELDVNKNWIRQNNILPVFGRGTNDWTHRTVEFQTDANTRYLYVYANIWNGYGTFWMDDITVSLKTNMVVNPGFESGTTTPLNWNLVDQGGNTPILDSVSHSGSRSIKISIPGTTNMISGYPQSDLITVEPLTTYTASVWGKTQNTGGSNTPAARVVELDANKNWIRQNNILPVFGRGTNDWAQRTVEFQTDANTRYLYVYANIWNGYGNFWMDDVVVKLKDTPTPTVTATPPTPTPTPSGSCYIIRGGVPSSMTKYIGKTVCANCGHHSPIPSTWKPCGTTPTPTVTATVTVTPTVTATPILGSTIAYLGDARPSKFGTAGITELTKDLNQVVPQSPTGKVDAIFMIGDMDKISQTQKAYSASKVNNIPIFYVVGNHEVDTSGDVAAIKAMTLKLPVNRGPTGTEKTTYSVDVGGIHVVNMNEYWDGKTNDAYGSGYVPDALYNWMSTDLSGATNYKIVLGHEPLYPKKRHVGDSLDANTANRNKLQNLFVSKDVKVFVGAHTHYATVNTVGGVYHVDAGISGQKTVDGEDPYASIFYTHTTENNLVLTWKHENPTWSTPKIATYTISK